MSSKNANERENDDDDDELHEDESNNTPLTGLNISGAELSTPHQNGLKRLKASWILMQLSLFHPGPIIHPEINLQLQITRLPLTALLKF